MPSFLSSNSQVSVRHRIWRILFICAMFWVLLYLIPAQETASPLPRYPAITLTGQTMGTTYTVRFLPLGEKAASDDPKTLEQLEASNKLAAENLQTKIDALLAKINAQMSTYDPESELSQFNAYQSVDPYPVSPELAKIVTESLELCQITEGAFDPTIGPVLKIWNFGPAAPSKFWLSNPGFSSPRLSNPVLPNSKKATLNKSLPDEKTIQAALAQTGYQHLSVLEKSKLQKKIPSLQLDLSAIAKGYGVDQVALLLEAAGIKNYMVEIGGEIRCRGVRPNGTPWRIGIERPTIGKRSQQMVLSLTDRSLATSGDYRIFYEQQGKRFSHIINPRTGRPIEHRLTSVSVMSKDCQRADALATALLVMGDKKGFAWAEKENLAAFFILRIEDGSFKTVATDAWKKINQQRKFSN